MVSRSWSPYSDDSGAARPSLAAEPVVSRVDIDDLVFSAAELLQAALGLTLTRRGIPTEGK
ncbi:hypothetical protein WKI68_29190 [Streptomyces sp. MS1.HAVA.3]|uniref:Uncharacterized protein n=1 Tax=Streptomyces caledonius TaxID=3134107 RepID=A0ABU8U9E8_9ACTN